MIHAVRPLWNLKYSRDAEYQKLYQYLTMIKEWRNFESHISPTASKQEVDAAIKIIITMYFFATGSCITDLEMAGLDLEDNAGATLYQLPDNNDDSLAFAADDLQKE